MLSLMYLVSALVLGTAIARRLGLKLTLLEAPALAISFGLIIWTWVSFLTALVLPYNFSLPATTGLAAIASLLLWRSGSSWRLQPWTGGNRSKIAWSIFTLITTCLIGWLMLTHYLVKVPAGIVSANSTWADFGLHASLISHFALSDRLSLDLPVAAGAKLTYPFMVDLLSAWLLRGGWSLHAALVVPSLLLITAFLQLMLGFGLRLFGGIGGSIIGLTLILLSGSAVGGFTAFSDYKLSGLSLTEFFTHLPKDYSTLTIPNAQVSNIIADIILPQRGFLMGFAAFAVSLILFTQLGRRSSRHLAIFTGAFIGLLPLVHAHTYVVLMAVIVSWCSFAALRTKRLLPNFLLVGATSLIIALPQILWQSLANGNGTGGFFSPGWVVSPGESLMLFWIHNYGLTGLIIVGLTLVLTLYGPLRKYLVWYIPLVAVFVGANIYSLQPFAYDNLKLILYVYLMTYVFVGYGAIWLVRRYLYTMLPLAAAGILIMSTGTLAVAREFQHSDVFASSDDIELAVWVQAATKPTDVFITTDRPNQPVATLAGRSIVFGYRGWLYAYHLDYQTRLNAVQDVLSAQMTFENPYHAQYLAVSSFEPVEWTVDRPALDAKYKKQFSNASWTVYRL